VTGRVTVTTSAAATPTTHVEAALAGDDLEYYENNTLELCLLGSS